MSQPEISSLSSPRQTTVQVKASYWIRQPGEANSGSSSTTNESPTRIQCFGPTPNGGLDRSHTTIADPHIIGLPEGALPTKRDAGDYSYSGRHDHGPLPPLKEGGPLAILLACTQSAKDFNDGYLTEVIAKQQKSEKEEGASLDATSGSSSNNPVKKARVEDVGS